MSSSNFNFSIIFNPGHSPGSVSFVIEDLVFCGDLIFKGSIGRTDLPLGNPIDMKKSLSFFVNSFDYLKLKKDSNLKNIFINKDRCNCYFHNYLTNSV